MYKKIKQFLLFMGLCVGLAGTSAHALAVETHQLIIKDHVFSPAEISIPANTKVKLEVINQDDSAEEFESHSLHREKIIPGGATRSIYIGPLEPGIYEFFGEFNPKTAKGRVIVK